MHQIPKLKRFSSRLAVVFAKSIWARCWVGNEDVFGAAPTGDVPTTSETEWSTILLPIKVRLILEVLQYVLNGYIPPVSDSLGQWYLTHKYDKIIDDVLLIKSLYIDDNTAWWKWKKKIIFFSILCHSFWQFYCLKPVYDSFGHFGCLKLVDDKTVYTGLPRYIYCPLSETAGPDFPYNITNITMAADDLLMIWQQKEPEHQHPYYWPNLSQ